MSEYNFGLFNNSSGYNWPVIIPNGWRKPKNGKHKKGNKKK